MNRFSMRPFRVLGIGVVLACGAGLSSCAPEESDTMRKSREQRDQQELQSKEMLRDARHSVQDQLRELGVKNR
jgi:hypothetical protein